jgi:hypothetical protein
MAMGPVTFVQMEAVVAMAEAEGTDAARVAGFEALAGIVRWLRAGVDMPGWRVS